MMNDSCEGVATTRKSVISNPMAGADDGQREDVQRPARYSRPPTCGSTGADQRRQRQPEARAEDAPSDDRADQRGLREGNKLQTGPLRCTSRESWVVAVIAV